MQRKPLGMFDRQQSIRRAKAIDVSSTDQTLTEPTRAVYITTAGNLIVILADDSASVTYPVLANTRHELRIKTVVKSGTTAAGLLEF